MGVPHETSDKTSSASGMEVGSNLFERTIVAVLSLLAAAVHCIFLMLVAPKIFAQRVSDESTDLPPPYSFLLASLMFGGISIRMTVAFFGQNVDHELLGRLASTAGTITLEDVFVLTVPCIILVTMVGAGVARWTVPQISFRWNPVVRVMCYAGGMQFALVGLACLTSLVVKAMNGTDSAVAPQQLDRVVLGGIAALIVSTTLPVYYVVRLTGQTFWARSAFTAGPLSLIACIVILTGTTVMSSISFDLKSTIDEAQVSYQKRMLSDVTIAIRTLSSRMTRDSAGRPQIQMTLAMVNVTEKSAAVPRPFELEHAGNPRLEPIPVNVESPNSSEDAGWIVAPGDTQLVRWRLTVPRWLADPDYSMSPLLVRFDCFPLNGTFDLFDTHPVGDARMVLGELRWPMLDAVRAQDQERMTRISGMLNESRVW